MCSINSELLNPQPPFSPFQEIIIIMLRLRKQLNQNDMCHYLH